MILRGGWVLQAGDVSGIYDILIKQFGRHVMYLSSKHYGDVPMLSVNLPHLATTLLPIFA